jgi:glycerophosphoryl diester phosphodiesterase
MLVYELKPHSSDEVEDLLIDITIQKLKEHELLDPKRVMFISFSMHICEAMAQKLPGFTIQYLNGDKSPKSIAPKGINGIDYKYKVLYTHKRWINQARKRNMSTNSWTVNKDKDISNILKLKVDMITTDYPVETRKIMNELKIQEQ